MACRINGRVLWGWRATPRDENLRENQETALQGTDEAHPRIRLIEPWGGTSWLVWYPGPYANGRPPHVRLRIDEDDPWPEEAVEGASFELREPRRQGNVVMREVVGFFVEGNLGTPAHITVHYGGRPASDFRLLREGRKRETAERAAERIFAGYAHLISRGRG